MHQTVPQRIKHRVEEFPTEIAQYAKDEFGVFQPTTYREMWQAVEELGSALLARGVARGDHVGIIADNRSEWLHLDLALLSIGAIDVPRGTDATTEEVVYILAHAGCRTVIAENRVQAGRILERRGELAALESILIIESDDTAVAEIRAAGLDGATVHALREEGAALDPGAFRSALTAGATDEVATLIYTSGTTGEPKGVMLPHRSYIFQMDRIRDILSLTPSDIFLSVLPIWHSFERAVDYVVLNYGAAIAYSRPIGQVLLDDMAKIRPTWMTSVPRIWEGVRAAVYRTVRTGSTAKRVLFHTFVAVGETHAFLSNMLFGRLPTFQPRSRWLDAAVALVPLVALTPFHMLGSALVFRSLRAKLGGRFVAGVSGGGALPPYVDRFFQAAGIKLLEGYGLTETGPVLAVRLQRAPVPGTVGPLLPDIDHRVLGEDGREVGPGRKGVLHVKSPQVMLGYYKRPEATAAVLSEDGWLNTGDIVVFTHRGEFRILGREKDTIVLLGGENVEPGPIEERLVQSPLIEQAMVVGQDRKFLGALIVPSMEELSQFAREAGIEHVEAEELLDNEAVHQRVHSEIDGLVNAKTGFKVHERIYRFTLLARPFEVGRELTQTLKIRRTVAAELYASQIDRLFR